MALEGPQCAGVGLAPSGLAAITTTLLSVLKAGDHLLVDRQRLPSLAQFLQRHAGPLRRRGQLFRSADRRRQSKALFKPNTKAVLVEAPGSQSFEMTDIPAIAEVAHARGALVIDDNTWATPLYHRSLDQGVDISMQAATKYIGGHSDIMFGTISANAKAWPLLAEGIRLLGVCAGPGRRLPGAARHRARFRCGSHSITARASKWRAGSPTRPEVAARVLHPALESHPGHAIWKRDFTGASGLFSIVLKPAAAKGGRCPARYRQAVRHGLFLGRL